MPSAPPRRKTIASTPRMTTQMQMVAMIESHTLSVTIRRMMNDAATAKPAVTSALLSRAESMLNMNQSDELWNGAIEAVGRAATYCSHLS